MMPLPRLAFFGKKKLKDSRKRKPSPRIPLSLYLEALEDRLAPSITPLTTGAFDHRWPSINNQGDYAYSAKDGSGHWQVFRTVNQVTTQLTSDGNNNEYPSISDAGDIVYFKDGGSGGNGWQIVRRSAAGSESTLEFSSRNNLSGAHRDANQYSGIASNGTTISGYNFYSSGGTFFSPTQRFNVSGVGQFPYDFGGSYNYPDINAHGDVLFAAVAGLFSSPGIYKTTKSGPFPGTLVASATMGRINDSGDIVTVSGNLNSPGTVIIRSSPDYTQTTFVGSGSWADVNNQGDVIFENVDAQGMRQLYLFKGGDHLVVSTQPPGTVVAGDKFDVKISAVNANGNVDQNFTGDAGKLTIAVANDGTNPGGGALGGTLTVPVTNGVADFSDLTLDKPGTGYTLQTTSGTAGSATTNPFVVTASPDIAPTSLVWNPILGGVDFSYMVTDADLARPTTAALYWASGPTLADTIGAPIATQVLNQQHNATPYGPINLQINIRPSTATQLILITDPDNLIVEGDETNNVKVLALPSSQDILRNNVLTQISDGIDPNGILHPNIAMTASFVPRFGGTADTAAKLCGYDHFNWIQVVVNDPFPKNDASGHVLSAPYLDPPIGGYDDLPMDNLPFVYNEPPYQSNWDSRYLIVNHTFPDKLTFIDAPADYHLTPGSRQSIDFTTSLVGVNAGNVRWRELFTFTWRTNFNGRAGTATWRVNEDIPTNGTGHVFNLVPNIDLLTLPRSVRELMAANGGDNISVAAAAPTLTVSDSGGTYNGSPFTATATVAGVFKGVDDTPASTLENVGLTLDYLRINLDQSLTDLGASAPVNVGSYKVVASFSGSQDYTPAGASTTFTIAPNQTGPDIQLVKETYFGGTGNETGTGVAAVNAGADDKVYVSGRSDAMDGEGILVKFNTPVASSNVTQDWNTLWPGATGPDSFQGVTAASNAVYAAGLSYSRTTDLVGDKENKGVTVSFPSAGGPTTWVTQTPAAPGAFTYGGIERLNSVTTALEGGQTVLYVTGTAQSNGINGGRLFLSKLDANGHILWTRTDPPATPNSGGQRIVAFGDNVYVAGNADDSGAARAYLKKYDSSGNLIWSRLSGAGIFFGLTADPANGFLYAVGQTTASNRDFLIEKWDLAGNRIWSQTYDHNSTQDVLNAVTQVNNRLYAVGSTTGSTAGGSDGAILEIDPDTGNLLNTILWGGAADDSFQDVTATATHLHVVGTTKSFGAGGSDVVYTLWQLPAIPVITPTATDLTANPNPSTQGQSVTFTATVTAGTVPVTSGTVTFEEGSTILAGDVALDSSGHAGFSISTLAAATSPHTITALYNGTAQLATSSGSTIETVAPAASGVTISYKTGYASLPEPALGTVVPYYFTITLPSVPKLDTTVYYRTEDGAAKAGEDYLGKNNFKVFFRAGSSGPGLAQTIAIQVKGDDFEGVNPETFRVVLTGAYNAVIDPAKKTATGTIAQTTHPLPVTASIADFSAGGPSAGSTVFDVPLTLANGPAAQPITVYYSTTDGTAKSGTDYVGQNQGHVTIAAGQTSADIPITVYGNAAAQMNETFTITLYNPVNATLGSSTATITIVYPPAAPATVISADSLNSWSPITTVSATDALDQVFAQMGADKVKI